MSLLTAIPSIGPDLRALEPKALAGKGAGGASSFGVELASAVERLEQGGAESGELVQRLLRGDNVELHTVALRAQEAQASFEMFLQIRNKLVQGYQEIMRMQL